MSILTQVLEGKITFAEAATQVEKWVEGVISHSPALGTAMVAVRSDLKQAASNAIDMADTALGTYILPASKAVEVALDGVLAGVLGGSAVAFNPLVNDGIDRIAEAVKAQADAWALAAKAKIITPPASALAGVDTTPAPVVG